MATDYLSALNVGSGLNTTEIIDSLVDAERAPRESLITAAKEEKTVSISALGTVKTELSTLNTSLGVIKTVNGLAPIQSGNSVAIEISDANEASAFSHQIQVSNLAKAQTLAFDGFTSASQSLGAGSLTISFGAWNSSSGVFTADSNQSDQTITIADGNDTLTDVKDTINAADIGVYASIIDTGDGNFTLLVTSETGENNALKIVASETVSNSGLAGLDFSSYDASQEVISATDANFSIDGLDVVRETNIIDDVFDGIKMTLVSTTSSAETIGASWDSATALAAMNSFVISINDFRTTLSNLSSRGVNGAESGPLAGNSLTRNILSRVRNFTTQAIEGYGEDPIYLANFGMKTELDGNITLDEDVFVAAFEADPSSFNAIIKNNISSSDPNISASVITDNWTPGNYQLTVDDSGSVTIDGDSMALASGVYSVTDGNANGLLLEIGDDISSGTIYMGRSMINQLQQYIDDLLAYNNNIDYAIDSYNSDISEYEDKLTALDNQMIALRQRYVSQFSSMDSLVASLKKTEEGLKNMMDAWRSSLER